jgi:hypothetical protein
VTGHVVEGEPAKYLGHAEAIDEATAIDKAAKEFDVPDNLRDRIPVMRDDG